MQKEPIYNYNAIADWDGAATNVVAVMLVLPPMPLLLLLLQQSLMTTAATMTTTVRLTSRCKSSYVSLPLFVCLFVFVCKCMCGCVCVCECVGVCSKVRQPQSTINTYSCIYNATHLCLNGNGYDKCKIFITSVTNDPKSVPLLN